MHFHSLLAQPELVVPLALPAEPSLAQKVLLAFLAAFLLQLLALE